MGEIQFRQKISDIRLQELMIEVMLLQFTADNTTCEDIESHQDKLVKFGEEYAIFQGKPLILSLKCVLEEITDWGAVELCMGQEEKKFVEKSSARRGCCTGRG